MRRLRAALAVSALVACGAGAGGVARAAQPVGVSVPTVVLATTELSPGDRVIVNLVGWTTRNVTLSVCGNLARRGAVDCNLSGSQALKLVNAPEATPTEFVVVGPPGSCPCVIRASSATQGEVAVAPFELVGWAAGPVVDPVFDALLAVSVDVRAAPRGLLAAVRTTLAGRTDYLVTATVRNLTTEWLPGISLAGSAGRSQQDQDVSFDMPSPDVLAPGDTWQREVRVTLPSPVLKEFSWRVIASGAGMPVTAELETHSLPMGLVVVLSSLTAAVVAMLCRLAHRCRERRRENADQRRGAGEQPSMPGPVTAPRGAPVAAYS